MIRRYEALMLAIPELTKDETANLEKGFDGIVRGAKGTTISFERWGKYRLAFPIRKNDYGIYFLARFEIDEESSVLDDLKTFFTIKANDVVMRDMITRLEPKASLAYQRPKSLEEVASSRDVGTFLKENKMEGLMPSNGSEEGVEEVEVAEATTTSPKNTADSEDIEIAEIDADDDAETA